MAVVVRSLLPHLPVIEARFEGRVDRADVEQAFADVIPLFLELDVWCLLADCSDLVWTPRITDLKELVDVLAALGGTERFREALIRPTDVTAATSVGFWEAAGVNRGLAIRMFRERDEAVAWLTASHPTG
jgi:hypothetical protein